jgi:hypothetical protein
VCVSLGGQSFCQPTCETELDCGAHACVEVSTLDGSEALTCVAERGSAPIGGDCRRDDDCAGLLASCSEGTCVAPCETDADCSYETFTNEPARCARVPMVGQVCVAGCNGSNSMCAPSSSCLRIAEGDQGCFPSFPP